MIKIIISVIVSCVVGVVFMFATDPPNLTNLFGFGFASLGIIFCVNWIISKIKSRIVKKG